ncbi:MAG: enoyl-CoA hydratase/isomerase family protein, partial [Candidatus Lambdaproteobacteria bacterium]|nr:enoyl-CoA hydratase/isomerase family protein [Candidatus Lambdaproteobacteria bacterium]
MAYDYRTLRVERSGPILTLTFDRPHALNAVDEVMHGELARVFAEIAADPAAEVVILTGAGRGFSAGGDTALLQHMIDDEACWRKTHREAKRITLSLLELHQPVIAKVNGPAAGLGATLALCSDVIFASDKASFG